MGTNNCDIDSIWDTFHYSCIIFYGAYGLLCTLVYRWYSRHIYFRGNWEDKHDTDRILEYFAIGAGECCLVMAAFGVFCYKALHPNKTNDNGLSDWTEAYLIFQIICWIMWTITEAYYTIEKVEWRTIGCVHVTLCIAVLIMAITNYSEVKNNCL